MTSYGIVFPVHFNAIASGPLLKSMFEMLCGNVEHIVGGGTFCSMQQGNVQILNQIVFIAVSLEVIMKQLSCRISTMLKQIDIWS